MQMKTALCAWLATAGLAMAGCSSDDSGSSNGASSMGGDSGGGSGGSGNSASGGSGGTPVIDPNAPCPDHPDVTDEGDGLCSVSSSLNSPTTDDLTMDNAHTWLLDGPVVIGDDAAATVLTVEPGTTVYGGANSFLLIQRHSKLMAEGTAANPILFSSAEAAGSRGSQDWGGLVINGLAPINNADDADGSAPGEAETGRYGGSDAADSSGTLKYVRIEFAGALINQLNELNGIAFQGVGSGTTVDYVQTHMTADDGVEFFGGTVNVSHLVVTGAQDDSIDWTGGFSGSVTYAVAEQMGTATLSDDPRGMEMDNLDGDNSATPYSDPTISNVTLIGRGDNDIAEGMRIRRGTKGTFSDIIVQGFTVCVNVTEDQTAANVTDGSLSVSNMVLNCPDGDTKGTPDGDAAIALLAAGTGIDSATDPMLNGWTPEATGLSTMGAYEGGEAWWDGWIETATE